MSSDCRDLEGRIRGFLRDRLRLADADIRPDTPMVTTGLLDSVALVRLAAFLERELAVSIPDRDINADNFDSILKICAYLKRLAPG